MAWLPNTLTVLRLLFTPVIVYLILGGQCKQALLLSMFVGATDGLDGYLARRFGWMSRTGAYLDPLADKFLLVSLYGAFWWMGVVPGWLAAVVFGRDLLILAMVAAGWAFTKIREFPPRMAGKVSTVIQIVSAAVLLGGCADIRWAAALRGAAIAAVAAGTLMSGADYVIHAVRMAAHRRR